tara:strand:- start:273 stop:422 length:150 start_codon:yes stop_codon:yes gene_type:complete
MPPVLRQLLNARRRLAHADAEATSDAEQLLTHITSPSRQPLGRPPHSWF